MRRQCHPMVKATSSASLQRSGALRCGILAAYRQLISSCFLLSLSVYKRRILTAYYVFALCRTMARALW